MRVLVRLDLFLAVTLTASAFATLAWPAENTGPAIWRDSATGLAIGGFDPVGYFTRGRPVEGLAELGLRHAGAGWQFENFGNRAAFERDPEAYMPGYFGFDPLTVADGKPVIGQPGLYRIREGKLYLFSTASNRMHFDGRAPVVLAAADKRWPALAPDIEGVHDR